MCRERREGAITCRCVVYFSEKVGVGSYVRNAEPYDDFGSERPRTKQPLRLTLVGIFATILTIFSIQSAGANHIHMHGGPFVGVVLGVIMTLWCISGFVMMYQGFPETSQQERLAGLAPLDLVACCADLPIAADTPADSLRIEMLNGEPVLLLGREAAFGLNS